MNGAPITLEKALAHLRALAPPPESERLPLSKCLGRTLHDSLASRTTLPPSDVSAMDGYAVRHADTREAGNRLALMGTSPAGKPFEHTLAPGEAVRIFTGGAIPKGADHILIQEEAAPENGQVRVLVPQAKARHIRKAGLDFHAGDTLLEAGSILGPAQLAIAAAANHDGLHVVRRPKVFIISNGNELRPPGSRIDPGHIIESNSYALSALTRLWGGGTVGSGLAPDSIQSIKELIDEAREADLIVAVGGASVGDHDLVRAAFKASGARMVFEKVAIKPGKPTWCATLGKQTILGLPGNPASAYVCAHLFLPALLQKKTIPPVEAGLSEPLPANGPRESFLRGRLSQCAGQMTVSVIPQQDTALLSPFLIANCLVHRLANDGARQKGGLVKCLPLAQFTAPTSYFS